MQIGLYRQALATLVLNAQDVHSAEVACLHHGSPISYSIARNIAMRLDLPTDRLRMTEAAEVKTEPAQSDLMRLLIEVLLSASSSSDSSSTLLRFVNAQAGHLDVVETLDRLPSSAPISSIRPFLERRLRNRQHEQHESTILKALAIGRFQEMDEALWERQQEMGAILAEADGSESPLVEQKPLLSSQLEDKIFEKLDRRAVDDMGDEVIELR